MAVTSGAPDPRRIYLVTKHSVFLGWLAIAAWAGAGVMWFVRLQRHSALSAQYYERSGSDARSFEPFLDNEYLCFLHRGVLHPNTCVLQRPAGLPSSDL